jgi:hypothetical protein
MIMRESDQVMENPNEIFKLYQRAGMSPDRFNSIAPRIAVGYMLAKGSSLEQINGGQVPAEYTPTPEEVELIKQNLDAVGQSLGY